MANYGESEKTRNRDGNSVSWSAPLRGDTTIGIKTKVVNTLVIMTQVITIKNNTSIILYNITILKN